MNMTALASIPDEELWKLSCSGDREAFGRIVERYQSLICSLAYSACGNFAAQRISPRDLRDSLAKSEGTARSQKHSRLALRIVRNLSANSVRRTVPGVATPTAGFSCGGPRIGERPGSRNRPARRGSHRLRPWEKCRQVIVSH
jgi:hypothetical protein